MSGPRGALRSDDENDENRELVAQCGTMPAQPLIVSSLNDAGVDAEASVSEHPHRLQLDLIEVDRGAGTKLMALCSER